MQAITVRDWQNKLSDEEFIEMQGKPIAQQLKMFDDAGSGIGFIFYLEPTVADSGDDVTPEINLQIKAQPVLKVKNDWYTVCDENVAEILAAIIRMLR